jgi:hypothetical protein
MELLPELVAQGRWLTLFREARALMKAGRMRWRGALISSFGPWIPEALWMALQRHFKNVRL